MDDDRQKKILLMRISIATFIVLLFSVWAFNLKNVWIGGQRFAPAAANVNGTSWISLKADLSRVLSDTQNQWQEIEKVKAEKEQSDKNSFLNNLLGGVGELAAATGSSATSTVAISSAVLATTTPSANATSSALIGEVIKKIECPEYINCMPSIGKARPCKVPVGCENVTTIAY